MIIVTDIPRHCLYLYGDASLPSSLLHLLCICLLSVFRQRSFSPREGAAAPKLAVRVRPLMTSLEPPPLPLVVVLVATAAGAEALRGSIEPWELVRRLEMIETKVQANAVQSVHLWF